MGQFSDEYTVSSSHIHTLMENDPELAEMYEVAKDRLGARREKLLHSGSFHLGAYNKSQHFFDTHIRKETRKDRKEDITHAAEARAAVESAQKQCNISFTAYLEPEESVSPKAIPEKSVDGASCGC